MSHLPCWVVAVTCAPALLRSIRCAAWMRGAHDPHVQNARNNKYDVAKYVSKGETCKVENGVSSYPAFIKEELVFVQKR